MSTFSASPSPGAPTSRRPPLRLNLAEPGGAGSLAGVWWPRSRDIDTEVADLVGGFPGRVSRILFSRPEWDTHPRSVQVGARRIKTGSFPSDDTHLVILTMSDDSVKRLLVVPPGHSGGESLMELELADVDHHDARALLATAAAHPDFDLADQWNDDGGSWWHPNPTPPSLRTP